MHSRGRTMQNAGRGVVGGGGGGGSQARGGENRPGGNQVTVKSYSADNRHKAKAAREKGAGRTMGFSSKPSSRLQNRQGFAKVAEMGKSRNNSNFSRDYHAGNIPFCIDHGSINSKLKWNDDPENLDYDPLFITCLEGITEVEHPYVFMARTAVMDLLYVQAGDGSTLPRPHATQKLQDLMSSDTNGIKIIKAIRGALMVKDEGVTLFALRAVRMISENSGPLLNKYLKQLVPQIHKKSFNKCFEEAVNETFQKLEEHGGKPALTEIKKRVPTYNTIFL